MSAATHSDVEAAVYFCCLEAMQNAGKHAGEGSRLTVTVEGSDDELLLRGRRRRRRLRRDERRGRGHGFVNMADRLGAIGGSLEVDSAPGQGTRIYGHIKQPARAVVA